MQKIIVCVQKLAKTGSVSHNSEDFWKYAITSAFVFVFFLVSCCNLTLVSSLLIQL